MKRKRRLSGVLLIITALIIMQLPVSEADAATSASDFKMEGTTLVKYRGTEKDVSIPNTVEIIGKSAFEENDKVEKIVIPKTVKKIEPYAFWGCDSLAEVVLGKGLTEVNDYAFTNCKGLQKITIPSGVKSIGIQAFADCVNLTDISISPDVFAIHETAFDGCAKLVIHCKEGTYADSFADAFYEKQKEMPEYEDVSEYITPDDSEDEYDGEEDNNSSDDDSWDYEPGNVLGSTQIVGNHAVLFIDNTSPVVHDGASNGSDNVNGQESIGEEIIGNLGTEDGLAKYTIVDGSIVADQAYYRNKELGSVVLPQGIVEIGQFAYARSTVNDITISEGVTKIGYGAFYHCDKLEKVSLPYSIETVEPKAFVHTPWVEKFLTDGEENFLISGNVLIAYRGMSESVTIPDGVTVIAGEVFINHTEIAEVILPETLRVIGEGAFEGCLNLTKIQMGANVEKIKDRAFADTALSEMTLPASIKEVGLKSFAEDVTLTYADGRTPGFTHELSAERLSNEAYRNLPEEALTPGVTVTGAESALARLEGAKRHYTLSVNAAEDISPMQTAYERVFHGALPEDILVYECKLTDASEIPLTKLGKQFLEITLPLPEQFADENIKVLTLDRNGQLETVVGERVLLDGADAVRIRTNHLSLFGIYGDGTTVEQSGIIEVSTQIQDMSAAPDGTLASQTGIYLNFLKWGFTVILLLGGSVKLLRKTRL